MQIHIKTKLISLSVLSQLSDLITGLLKHRGQFVFVSNILTMILINEVGCTTGWIPLMVIPWVLETLASSQRSVTDCSLRE
jgi:hypothetical protein